MGLPDVEVFKFWTSTPVLTRSDCGLTMPHVERSAAFSEKNPRDDESSDSSCMGADENTNETRDIRWLSPHC